MASKKLSSDTSLANSYKLSRGVASVARPSAPTIGTGTDTGSGAISVTFTASTLGPSATSFTLTSSSGVTASGASSPLTLQEAAAGTYTYTVYATNANGNSASSAASNSVVVASVFSPVGSFDALATVLLSTSTSSITFTGIPTGYTHLQVRALHRGTVGAGDGTVYMRFNDDTSGNYSWHRLYGYGGGTAGADSSVTTTSIAAGQSMGATPSIQAFSAMITDVLDYSNVSKNTTVRSIAGTDVNNDASGAVFFNSGTWYRTSSITSIVITNNQTAFAANSSFALYGVK